eukprot:354778-Chlamydomonas_euryale.AAC.1
MCIGWVAWRLPVPQRSSPRRCYAMDPARRRLRLPGQHLPLLRHPPLAAPPFSQAPSLEMTCGTTCRPGSGTVSLVPA